ncbi:MAG: hypothetical protein ABI822_01805, partial [Bryobacteraceae bacterium]
KNRHEFRDWSLCAATIPTQQARQAMPGNGCSEVPLDGTPAENGRWFATLGPAPFPGKLCPRRKATKMQ